MTQRITNMLISAGHVILKYIKRVINVLISVINAILKNGFYILWSLVIPFLIVKMGQGQDMIEHLMDSKYSHIQIALIVATFTMLGYALWIIPTPSIRASLWAFGKKEDKKEDIFEDLVNKLNRDVRNNTLPIRYFAVAPIMLLIVAIIISERIHNKPHVYLIQTVFFLIFLIASYYLFPFILRRMSQLFLQTRKWIEYILLKSKFVRFFSRFLFQPKLLHFFRIRITTIRSKEFKRALAFNLVNILYYLLWFFTFIATLKYSPKEFNVSIILCLLLPFATWLFTVFYYIENRLYKIDDSRALDWYVRQLRKPNLSEQNKIRKTRKPRKIKNDKLGAYRITNINYCVLALLIFVFLIRLWYLGEHDDINRVSPILVLAIMFTVYLMLFDFLYKTPMLIIKLLKKNEKLKTLMQFYQIVLILGGIFFYYKLICSNIHTHPIRRVVVAKKDYYKPSDRISLYTYFKQWKFEHKQQDTILLIAGQGGGSRAAAWMHLVLNQMDPNNDLLDKVFAFSTASGSTVGVNMKMAEWKLNKLRKVKVDSTKRFQTIKDLYTFNYFGNSFYGILFGDPIELIIPRKDGILRDRNYRLQKEELKGFVQTYMVSQENEYPFIKNHFEDDYLSTYYPKNNIGLWAKPPLFFMNTALVQNGHRAVFSPVIMDSNFQGLDVYHAFKKANFKGYNNIPLVTASNQSQAFPVISAFNYIPGFGNLLDGGSVENSGCSTLLELYKSLKDSLNQDYLKNGIEDNTVFQILIIENSKSTGLYNTRNMSSSIPGTIKAFYSAGLYSYSYNFRDALIKEVSRYPKDRAKRITIGKDITLSRMLTNSALDSMQSDLANKGDLLKFIK